MCFIKEQRFCNRMMTFVYVFGGILCGLHKVHKTPRIPSVLKIWASMLQMFDMLRPGLLAGGILCVALNLILR